MDDQSELNLKGDFNTEGTEDTEKTGKRKKGEKIIAESGRDTEGAEKKKQIPRERLSPSNESGRGEPLPYS
jgi:hypothetical protein